MAADRTVMQRAKSTTFKSTIENFSIQDDVAGSVVSGGGKCLLEPNGRRSLQRALSMPGRIPPPSYGSTLSIARSSLRPRRTPSTTTALHREVEQPKYEVENMEKTDGGKDGSVGQEPASTDVAVTVRPATVSGAAGIIATASSVMRRHIGSTSFTCRRKRLLGVGVSVDATNVPQIDRAASPVPSSAGYPTITQVASAREAGRRPVYPRRFASLRLPSGGRTSSSLTARHLASSTLLSPVSSANGASDHRTLSGSYARMQLLQNIGKLRT